MSQAHPLVGRIWDVRAQTFVGAGALFDHFRDFDFVLLGERHDNYDHHFLQARVIDGMLARGRRPAIAFEMLDMDDEPQLVQWREGSSKDVDDFAVAVSWQDSGWPDFAHYRPVFERSLRASLPVAAANLSRAQLAPLWQGARMDLGAPLGPEHAEDLIDEILEAHCGVLGRKAALVMADAQRARDFHMARRLARVGNVRGAVLIAGLGHARTDRGVPYQLHALRPQASISSVAFLEVHEELVKPGDYASAFRAKKLPFDYVWFTPRADDVDPCEKFAAALGALSNKEPAAR